MPRRPYTSYPLPPAPTLGEAYELAAKQLLSDVMAFHRVAVEVDGGTQGIHDVGLLVSAVYQPFTLFRDGPAYKTGLHQAAALLRGIVLNHAFVDGNKRTATLACLYFLEQCGYWQEVAFASQQEAQALESLTLDIEQGRYRQVDEVARRLHHILSASRNRQSRGGRLLSGLFGLVEGFFDMLRPRE